MGLAHGYHEGMKLVKEAHLIPGGIGDEGLAGEFGQGIVFYAIASGSWHQKLVALGNAASSEAVIAALRSREHDASLLVREHVRWALAEHTGRTAAAGEA